MPPYVRPPLPEQVYYDSNGAVIEYGNRWVGRKGRMPPEDTYSVTSNPQRFQPLHTVADALIEHLTQTYAVTVEDDVASAADSPRRIDDAIRAVRVTPGGSDAAGLTFIYTAFPGVVVHAGLLHDFIFPDCGCDACDETAELSVSEMERQVLAVVGGGFSESVDWDAQLGISYELRDPDGRRSRGSTASGGYPTERLRAAHSRLRQMPNGWQPWQTRTE